MNPTGHAEIAFPLSVKSPASQVANRFTRTLIDLQADRSLHFLLARPIDWEIVNVSSIVLDPSRVVPIGLIRHTSVPKADAEVGVLYQSISKSVKGWSKNYLESLGYTIIKGREVESENGIVADILATIRLMDGEYVARTLAVPDGRRIFLVQTRCSIEDYESLSEDFLVILQSFGLAAPSA